MSTISPPETELSHLWTLIAENNEAIHDETSDTPTRNFVQIKAVDNASGYVVSLEELTRTGPEVKAYQLAGTVVIARDIAHSFLSISGTEWY